MECDCGKKTFSYINLSNGDTIHKCPSTKYTWNTDKGILFTKKESGFCEFEFIEKSKEKITHVTLKKKVKVKYKYTTIEEKFSNLELIVRVFKRKKTFSLYEKIIFGCKDLKILTFDEWENDDLGDYCEFLLNICTDKTFRKNYYEKNKSKEEKINFELNCKIDQIEKYFEKLERALATKKTKESVEISLENLEYCKNVLNKNFSTINRSPIMDIFNIDKSVLTSELIKLKNERNKLNLNFINKVISCNEHTLF